MKNADVQNKTELKTLQQVLCQWHFITKKCFFDVQANNIFRDFDL